MRRHGLSISALVFVAGGIAALGGFSLIGHDRAHAAGSTCSQGYGMMGGSSGGSLGPGMMRGALGGGTVQSSVTVDELRAVRDRVERQLSTRGYTGFTVSEVMAFTNNDYVLVRDAKGVPAFELLADPRGRWVMPEPTMMWNTAFGMMRGFTGGGFGMMSGYGCPGVSAATGGTSTGSTLSGAEAKVRANAWLAQNRSGEATADATPLPGYYTIDVTKNGSKVGMLSVSAKTGAVWFHTWHATFLADQDF